MKKGYVFLFLIGVMIFSCQQKKERITKPNDKALKSNSEYLINISDKKLPSNFTALDPIILYNNLSMIDVYGPSKKEFETTEEYKIREQIFLNKIYQSKIIDSIFTVKLSNDFFYDADKSEMGVRVKLGSIEVSSVRFQVGVFKKILMKFIIIFKYSAEYLIDIKKSERSNFENWYVIEIANPRDFKKSLKSGFLGFNFQIVEN